MFFVSNRLNEHTAKGTVSPEGTVGVGTNDYNGF